MTLRNTGGIDHPATADLQSVVKKDEDLRHALCLTSNPLAVADIPVTRVRPALRPSLQFPVSDFELSVAGLAPVAGDSHP